MDDHVVSFLSHLMTFLATLAGIVGGTIRSRNKAELAFSKAQFEFCQKELEQSRAREMATIGREDGLRAEITDRQHELRIMHQEYDAARQARMARGRNANTALVVIDGEAMITDVSENITMFVGWKAAELLGKPVEVLMPERERSAHKAYIQAASATGKRVIRGEDDIDARLRLLHRDGQEIPVTIALIGGGVGREARYTGSIRFRSSDSHDGTVVVKPSPPA